MKDVKAYNIIALEVAH